MVYVLFLIFADTQYDYLSEKNHIMSLNIPELVDVNCTWIGSLTNEEFADQMYNAVACRGYSYKVYIKAGVEILNKNFIGDVIRIFESDSDIGMVGMSGSRYLKIVNNHIVYDDICNGLDGNFGQVQMISADIFAVHYKLYWRMSMFGSWEQAVASQCMGYIRNKYKVFVPEQESLWIKSTVKNYCTNHIELANAFLKEYIYFGHSEKIRILYSFGQNAMIDKSCEIRTPENIWIGNHVRIEEGVVLEASDVSRDSICLDGNNIIGKGTHLCASQAIHLAKYVILGENVELSGECDLGWGTCVGDGAKIQNAMIGNFVTVVEGSIVSSDIPSHCKVAGNPARVIALRNYENGNWITINDDQELLNWLERRRKMESVFCIGIPTYQRSYFLNKNLKNIFRAIGDDDILSVYISDNHSTDDTEKVCEKYKQRYGQLVYSKCDYNIGGAENFKRVLSNSPGRYVLMLGDDIYIRGEAIYKIIEAIYKNLDCDIIGFKYTDDDELQIFRYKTADEFMLELSFWVTHISNYAISKDAFKRIEWAKDTKCFHQIDMLFQILRNNSMTAIVQGKINESHSGEQTNGRTTGGKKSCIGDVFISEYLDVLLKYKNTVISEKAYLIEKKNMLIKFVVPYIKKIANNSSFPYTLSPNIYQTLYKYYRDEDYYLETKNEIDRYVAMMKKNGRYENE